MVKTATPTNKTVTPTSANVDMKSLMSDLVRRSGADYCEIRIEDSREQSLVFMGKNLENVQESHMYGGNVRVLVNGCWGFVTFNSLEDLGKRVKEAVNNAKAASKLSNDRSVLAGVTPVTDVVKLNLKEDPRTISLEQKLALFGGYNERLLSTKGVTSTSTRYFDKYTRLYYANSDGTWLDREYMDSGMGAYAIATRDGLTCRGSTTQGGRNDFGIYRGMEKDIDEAAKSAVESLDAQVVKGGNYTVVCDPNLAGVFVHEAFGHLSEGDNVADDPRMQEILKLGRGFGQKYLNIWDTGLDVGLRGYLPYDDEGVPTQRTDLIREGTLVGRLHSRETAGRMKEKPTGNARALTYRFPPIPRMRNTVIGNGPHGSFNDLIKDVKLGIYAIDSMGGQTNGELFTFTAGKAFMIRDGKVAERVRDVTVGGNVFDTLKNITGVGSDLCVRDGAGGCGKAGQMPLPVSHGSPHIRIDNVVIGGR
ncbi:MAG: TldD/PmbA family protein [Planctomycetes bacterium]|nr:TldD/PmbA family protein [Planctomycetota bacterium]